MPVLGFGTWPMKNKEAERSVAQAIEIGYRLVDTAYAYGNERGVGKGLAASGIAREEIFVTTKFNREWHGVAEVRESVEGSLEKLGLDFVDLLLVHWPNPVQGRYVDAWEGMLMLREEGLIKAAGTSNFKPAHIDRLLGATSQAPEVNQIELSPLVTRTGPREYHVRHGIVTQSWSPLGAGNELLTLPVVQDISKRHGKSAAQVVLRWHIQSGFSTIPKTSTPARMRENLDIFGFELSDEDMRALDELDQGEAAATDSDEFGH
jgi:2,5-diketo-D-gluconate reductase A